MKEKTLQQNEVVNYHGYSVFKNGAVVSPQGRELKGYFFTYPYSHISVKYDGKNYKVLRAKLIFELFSGEKVSRKYILRFKDNNPKNCNFDNLYLESRKDYAKEHPHTNDRKFCKRVESRIRNTYYDENRNKKPDAPSLRELARKYKCSLSTIQKILKD